MSRIGPDGLSVAGPPRRQSTLGRTAEAMRRSLRARITPHLLYALPALMAGLVVVVLVPFLRTDPAEIRRFYEAVAAAARTRNDAATAGVCLDRLTLLGSESNLSSPEFGYQLAKLALDLGQLDRAEALLDRVALDERPVHAPAHVLRAVFLLRKVDGEPGPTPADFRRAERHLRHAVALNSEMPEANELLGKIALGAGDLARAEVHLQKAARANPGLNYQIADLLRRQGNIQSAAFWARRARDYYRPIAEKEPDNHAARLLWASSEEILGDHEAARAILLRGLARADLVEFHRALADSFLAEATESARASGTDPAARLRLLEGALQHNPDDPRLTEQISGILKQDGPGAERFRDRLQTLLAEGKSLTTVHLLLGYDAWEHGRLDEAKLHWGRALEADPRSSVVANNLAWALATATNPDLPRALTLVDLALSINPTDPSLLGTRGRVLGRLGRWQESLAALEAALPAQPQSRSLHADLADAYAALGSHDLAERHRRLAEAPTEPAKIPPK